MTVLGITGKIIRSAIAVTYAYHSSQFLQF